MKRLVRELNQRAIELDSKIENAKTERMEMLFSGGLQEVERIMKQLIDMGYAEVDNRVDGLVGAERYRSLELADQRVMQIKAVHYKIRESR